MVYGFNDGMTRRPYAWAHAVLCASVIVSMGCKPDDVTNIITGMSFSGRSQRPDPNCDGVPVGSGNCTAQLLESLQFAKVFDQIIVGVQGTGTCNTVTVDFGDGGTTTEQNVQFTRNVSVPFAHHYTQWPGKKQVRVTGTGCLGEFTKELSVGIDADGHEEFRVAIVPTTSVCQSVRYLGGGGVTPRLRPGSVVRIVASGTIDYGDPVHDAGGDNTIVAPAGYPFQSHRPYSLIYRLPGQEIQGENGPVLFTAASHSPLEICANDHPSYLANNAGGIFLQISVNESQATGPD
jgi:hypothetical protein